MSPLPSHIRQLAMEALDSEYTRVPATALVEALGHKGVGIITLAQNNPGMTEDELRGAFARVAMLLSALELELEGNRSKSTKIKAKADKKMPATYKGFSVEDLEPFYNANAGVTEAVGFVDGCCQSNPGPAGVGGVLMCEDGMQLARVSQGIGVATNNIAEYSAFIALMQVAQQIGIRRLNVYGDSELMVKQVNGIYKVRHENIMALMVQVNALMRGFESVTLRHVPREENKIADALSTWCLDREKYNG